MHAHPQALLDAMHTPHRNAVMHAHPQSLLDAMHAPHHSESLLASLQSEDPLTTCHPLLYGSGAQTTMRQAAAVASS